ncbi:hypothetical protein [Kiloniella majae]|uniref:hypothetical protein n=1 Tax=Kiloniella majae TaxID=1938558 RepID=UPI000A2787BF|nr:hypothetical protein [Kiloniella majae]
MRAVAPNIRIYPFLVLCSQSSTCKSSTSRVHNLLALEERKIVDILRPEGVSRKIVRSMVTLVMTTLATMALIESVP